MNFWDRCDAVIARLPDLAPKLFHIRTKDEAIRTLVPNAMQLEYQRNRARRELNAKSRQLGFSTWKEVEGLLLTMMVEGFSGAIISHEREATKRLMSIVTLAHSRLPEAYRVPLAHDREDYLEVRDRDSRLYIGTAGQRKFGRGDTIHWLHVSELAHYADAEELMLGVEEAVPKNGYVCIESTPNGREYFYELYSQAAGRGYGTHFFPWWWDPEYAEPTVREIVPTEEEVTLMERAASQGFRLSQEQLQWRRNKVARLGRKFVQEYPEDAVSCFLTSGNAVFDPTLIERLLGNNFRLLMAEERTPGGTLEIWLMPGAGHRYNVGVDPSYGRAGADEAAMVVVDAERGWHCATWTGVLPPHQLAEQAARLGERYNDAMLTVERQGGGEVALAVLQEIKYRNVYHETKWYEPGQATEVPGWYTTRQSKERLCGEFLRALECGDFTTWDNRLLDQAMNVLRNDKGEIYTARGKDDHRLMAAMLANYTLDQVPRRDRKRIFEYAEAL